MEWGKESFTCASLNFNSTKWKILLMKGRCWQGNEAKKICSEVPYVILITRVWPGSQSWLILALFIDLSPVLVSSNPDIFVYINPGHGQFQPFLLIQILVGWTLGTSPRESLHEEINEILLKLTWSDLYSITELKLTPYFKRTLP